MTRMLENPRLMWFPKFQKIQVKLISSVELDIGETNLISRMG